jgi:hypothetical protein
MLIIYRIMLLVKKFKNIPPRKALSRYNYGEICEVAPF